MGVGKDGERQLQLPGELLEPFLRFEGDGQHDRSHRLYFPVMPPQLRQVFPSRESSKMAQENKDYLMPFELS